MADDHTHPSFSPQARERAWLASLLLRRQSKVMPRFALAVARFRGLSRGARRRFQRKAAVTLAGAALVLAIGAAQFGPPGARVAHAATITVADGEIAIDDNDICSLIEAIINANDGAATHDDCVAGSAVGDTIDLPANGSFLFDTVYANYQGDTGTPEVTTPISIEGNGSTFDVDGAGDDMRFFAVGNGADLTINALTMQNGETNEVGGGAIINDGGTLQVNDSTFINNYNNYYGGAIHTISGNTEINNSTFIHNGAESDGGGALSVLSGSLEVNDSLFTKGTYSEGNYTFAVGGAIYAYDSIVTIHGSTIEYSDADDGGAIFSLDSELTITDSVIDRNYGRDGGGVFASGGTLDILRTTISGNEGQDGGGVSAYSADVEIIQSAITGNIASGYGGGLYFTNTLGTAEIYLVVTNSTVSGNEARWGGGVLLSNRPDATFNNVTISDNSADDGGGLFFYNLPAYAGTGSVVVNRTLIAGNGPSIYGDEMMAVNATITANNRNLFGHSGITTADAFQGTFTPGASDITATSDGTEPAALGAILDALADNGGPTTPATETHALVGGSPAIDRAADADCDAPSPTDGVDQRDVARNQDGDFAPGSGNECDIGAYEYVAPVTSICPAPDNELTTLLGVGMGNPKKAVLSTKLVVPNAANLVHLYAQTAGKDVDKKAKWVRFVRPDKSYLQVNDITGTSLGHQGIYWFGAELAPVSSVTAKWKLVAGTKGKIPRAFVLYATHETDAEYFNAFTLFDDGLTNTVGPGGGGWPTHQTLSVPIDPPLADIDLTVQIALVDNDQDARTVTVTATAGTASEANVSAGPTNGNLLNLITLVLEDVPAGTDELTIDLETSGAGESAAVIGAAVNYACAPESRG